MTSFLVALALGATAMAAEPVVAVENGAVVVRLDRVDLTVGSDRHRLLTAIQQASVQLCRDATLFDRLGNRAACRIAVAREITGSLAPSARTAVWTARRERLAG
jgi:UrcA family protein